MNTHEIALAVGLHPKTVARFARQNVIPAQFVGGRHGWSFDLDSVLEALFKKRSNKPARALAGKKTGFTA